MNCIENPYIANYIKKRKQIEYEENTNEWEDTSQYPPVISYDESGNEEELSIQPISSIRSSKKRVKPTHDVKKKKKRRRSKSKKVSLPNDVAPTTHCDDLISLAHHNELSLLLGYEKMKRITNHIPEYNLEKFLDIDLEEFFV